MDKVLFVFDTLNTGGAEKSILEIASGFTRYKPVVCHLYPGDALKREFEKAGIEVISLNTPGQFNFRRALKSFEAVVNTVQPRLIHATLFRSDIVTRLGKKKFRLPLISSLVNNSYHDSRFSNAGFLMRLKLRSIQFADALTARRVDIFISNSETIKASNARKLLIPLEKIKTIYRGRSPENYISTWDSVKGAGNSPLVLNVSRLLDRKGQSDLLKAFVNVLKDFPKATLQIAGEGPHRKVLEREIQELHLEKHVSLLGNRDDIARLLALGDVFVFPSHYEGLPGSLIEAMFAKIPIVASDISENLECVDEINAMIFSVGDASDLAKKIKQVLVDSDAARRRSALAFDEAMKKFNIKSVVQQYELLYDQVLTT